MDGGYMFASRENSYLTCLQNRPHTLTHTYNHTGIPCGWNVFYKKGHKTQRFYRSGYKVMLKQD